MLNYSPFHIHLLNDISQARERAAEGTETDILKLLNKLK